MKSYFLASRMSEFNKQRAQSQMYIFERFFLVMVKSCKSCFKLAMLQDKNVLEALLGKFSRPASG